MVAPALKWEAIPAQVPRKIRSSATPVRRHDALYGKRRFPTAALPIMFPGIGNTATVSIYRYFATLHRELSPYNFSGIVDCHLNGGSQMKSCDKTNYTHKLGGDISWG